MVYSEEDIQVTRLMDRSQYTEAEAKKRIKAQMPLELKCEQSHFVIENSGQSNAYRNSVPQRESLSVVFSASFLSQVH